MGSGVRFPERGDLRTDAFEKNVEEKQGRNRKGV